MRIACLVLLVALLAGCGSGGGAENAAGSGAEPAPVATSAAVDISTLSASATVIYGVEFVLHLPAGVTVSAEPATGRVQPDALKIADSGALAAAHYQPATPQSQSWVKVAIVDAGGFTVGHLATLTCRFDPGLAVGPAGFSLDGFTAVNANGTAMPGIAPYFTLHTQ